MRHARTLASVAVVIFACACLPAVAAAQVVTITGYFDRTGADLPQVTDEIQVSTDGKTQRPFGVTHMQSKIGVGGTDVFKRSLKPVLLVRGPDELIAKLDDAMPVQRVRIIGVLMFSNMEVILTGVEVAPPPPSGTGAAGGTVPGETLNSR